MISAHVLIPEAPGRFWPKHCSQRVQIEQRLYEDVPAVTIVRPPACDYPQSAKGTTTKANQRRSAIDWSARSTLPVTGLASTTIVQAKSSHPVSCSAIGKGVGFSTFSRDEKREPHDVMQCNLVASS